jgi:hypothetical protein
MSFASDVTELRRVVMIMLETHTVMSSLIFCLILILVFRHDLILVLCLSFLMNPTIAHMVLVYERTALYLDALDTVHVLIVVIVSRVSLVFLQEGFTPISSRDTLIVHTFPIVVYVPLIQIVMCKRL